MSTPSAPSTSPPLIDHNQKGGRKQLSSSMEHIRYAVAVPEVDPSTYGMPGYIQPLRKPRTDSSSNPQKRTDPFQFGSRYLEEGDNIFDHNAWDHVETDETYRIFAEEQYKKQREVPVTEFDKKRFNEFPEKWWNKFYASNTSNFFKDRKWLHQEFPILGELSAEDAPPAIILEVGAGAGNTAFPVMKQNHNPQLRLHACDFSKNAVEVIKSSPEFNSADMVGKLEASVWDIASPKNPETGAYQLPEGLEPESVDVVVLIFIFSALAPSQWKQAVENVWQLLKPGGIVLFRDYGRGDLAQVRFKKGRWMEENFYVRGDGTRVYFFDEDELKHIWSDHNENSNEELELRLKTINLDDNLRPKFEVVDFGVDRRMLVNRQRRLKMYRCWMQAKFRKTQIPSSPVNHS